MDDKIQAYKKITLSGNDINTLITSQRLSQWIKKQNHHKTLPIRDTF